MPRFSLLTARYSGRRDGGEREPERQLAGGLAQHTNRGVCSSASERGEEQQLRRAENHQLRARGWYNEVYSVRFDRTELEEGALTGTADAVRLDGNGPIVFLVVHGGHNRRGSWAPRNRRWNVQGEKDAISCS